MTPSTILRKLDLYEKLLRLDKPIGILLLLWPTLWALWLATAGHPTWTIAWIFCLGTVLMRSAGVAVNDYADRNFDGQVARTRDRPLAAGLIKPREALIIAAVLAILAFILIIPLGRLVILLSFAALFLAATYPFTKRYFALPQAYLGVAFGFGIPMAYAAETEGVPAIAWTLLAANILWTLVYDTEYAMVDREDDRKIGIQTSALLLGRYDVPAVMLCYAAFLAVMSWIGWSLRLNWPYYVGLLVALALGAYQYALIRDRDPRNCFRAFLCNNWVGAVIFAGIVVGFLLQRSG
jgi:4-hydroxybenzoate polyprenyltransferase